MLFRSYKVLRRITGSYPVGGAFGILFLMLYILMIGCTVSAVRALTMFLFRVGADMTGRHYDAPTALSVAAVMVLLWRPLSLYDGGFWLSFGAVLAILAVVPVVQEGICTRTLHSNGQKMKMKTKVSVQEALSVYASRSTDVSYSGSHFQQEECDLSIDPSIHFFKHIEAFLYILLERIVLCVRTQINSASQLKDTVKSYELETWQY